MGDVDPDETAYEFDVAVSFAGEDREFVRAVVADLQATGTTVFFDEDQSVEMWGEDLVEYFDQVYRERARYAMLFISDPYVRKMWTRHERRSALARAVADRGTYVLPVRLDSTAVPGLRPTVGYLDGATLGPASIAAALRAKLTGVTPASGGTKVRRTPRSHAEMQELVSQRPSAWEYLLYFAAIAEGLREHEDGYRDHMLGYARRSGHHVSDGEAVSFLQQQMTSLNAVVATFARVLSPGAQEAAFGAPGEPGDPDRILHLASAFCGVYGDFLGWAARCRSTDVSPDSLRDASDLMARFADQPVNTMRDFSAEMVEEGDTIIPRLDAGEKVNLEVVVKLELGDDVLREYELALDRYRRRRD